MAAAFSRLGADDDGGLAALGRGAWVQPQAGAIDQHRAPGLLGGDGLEAVGVAQLLGLGDEGGGGDEVPVEWRVGAMEFIAACAGGICAGGRFGL